MHFVLKLSKLCNLRCQYCYEYEELGRPERMPLEGLEFMIRGIADWGEAHGWPEPGYRFVFHGGEPLLLPDEYLVAVRELQEKHLTPRGIPFSNSLQTNLFRVTEAKLVLLRKLGISLGISLDVFGDQSLTIDGRDSQPRVIENLQLLCDMGYADDPGIGAISVLHRGNLHAAEATFDFFNELGISYRILPVDLGIDSRVSTRCPDLAITNAEKVDALLRVAERHAEKSKGIHVWPLIEYFQSAVRHVLDVSMPGYDLPACEWALIVNTNGNAYNSGDAYEAPGYMGNVFRQSLTEIFASDTYHQTVEMRAQRSETCETCPFEAACPGIPVAETYPGEREYDEAGHLRCAVAQPLIAHYAETLLALPEARARLEEFVGMEAPNGHGAAAPA